VECVSWDASCEFCTRLGQRIGQPVRLPTEAEWEYACRAGTRSSFSFGDDPTRYHDYAILSDTGDPDDTRPDPVGRRKPNAWGLYDMHGNICEWCSESPHTYPSGKEESVDPVGPVTGPDRLVRGGTWHFVWSVCRSATRVDREISGTTDTGLRVCFTPEVSGTAPR
jgi:formylglycine-generating enzyme required for sulfatase activity